MTKNNKLPKKATQILNTFKAMKSNESKQETDTTTLTSSLTSTHIFNK